MKSLCRIHVWFPGIDQKVEDIVHSCRHCQKVANEPSSSIVHPWNWPTGPMDRVHVDFFGEFYGKNYLLMVDSYSCWGEVDIIHNTTTTGTIAILRTWFSRYGLPNQLITDNGPQFISFEFDRFCKQNGIKHIRVPAYHQSSNGTAEKFVQTVKKGLKSSDIEKGNSKLKLDNFLFAHRITPTTCTGKTPAELFLGRRLKSRIDLIKPSTP